MNVTCIDSDNGGGAQNNLFMFGRSGNQSGNRWILSFFEANIYESNKIYKPYIFGRIISPKHRKNFCSQSSYVIIEHVIIY